VDEGSVSFEASEGIGVKVVIAGGTGSLGRRVADDLEARDNEVVVLTRSRRHDITHRQVEWDGRTVGAWAAELEGAVIVNLAGELVDRRPTKRNIDLLRRSGGGQTETVVVSDRRHPTQLPDRRRNGELG